MASKRGYAAASLVAATLLGRSAHADDFHGTRSEALVESAHDVRITLHAGHAELVVRRTVYNGGARHDQAMFFIEPPRGAVATALRTLGSVDGRPHWFDGELMEAEAAAARYRELTGIGGYYPKDPALLSWRHQGQLALQVFPCPPAEHKSVEYTFQMPTSYSDGQHHIALPALGTPTRLAHVTVRAASRRERIFVDGAPLAAGGVVALHRDREVDVALVPRRPPVLDTQLGVVPVSVGRVLTRIEVQAAPRVSALPKGAYVVVVLDGSRSQRFDDAEAARAAAVATLSHLADAKVEVLTFDRRVHRRHGRFVSSARARLDLETLPVEQHNGSNLDAALLEAERLLDDAPAGAPRRILALTDGLTRASLRPERLRGALAGGDAIAHVGLIASGHAELSRDDEHPWAGAVRSSGGLLWHAHAHTDRDQRKDLARVYEEWARPLRVDRLRLFAPRMPMGSQLDGFEPPPMLAEGQGAEALVVAANEIDSLRVEGELWAKRVSSAAAPDAATNKLWAALVFGSERLHELDEDEMMTLARLGGAVSPVTSYLAIEPGVRPSTEGLEEGEGSGQGFGSGHGMLRMGATSASGRAQPLDRDEFLRTALGAAWSACGGKPLVGTVNLETTLAEVVDVPTVKIEGSSDPLLERCLSEAAWDLKLPAQFDEEWSSWTVYV